MVCTYMSERTTHLLIIITMKKILNSISGDDIRAILEDNAGRLWIGTSAGLDLFVNHQEHSQKGRFIHYQNIIDDKKSISKGPVMALFEDDKHNLWIGIENGGLDVINLKTYNKNTVYFHPL